MVTEETVDLWLKIVEEEPGRFPEYYVSMPPHRDTLQPVYYKVVGPTGPVFWRNKGSEEDVKTSLYDLWMEDRNGFGIQSVDKEYTPWSDE